MTAVALVDTTSKLYTAPELRPVSVTEWLVTSELLSVDWLPYAVVVP